MTKPVDYCTLGELRKLLRTIDPWEDKNDMRVYFETFPFDPAAEANHLILDCEGTTAEEISQGFPPGEDRMIIYVMEKKK